MIKRLETTMRVHTVAPARRSRENSAIRARGGQTEAPDPFDFFDPAREWRRIFSEAWGTFFLVAVAAGGKILQAATHGAVSDAADATASGLVVMVIIYAVGAVGGAHVNPAVTFAFAVRGNFPWRRVPGYVLAQLIGAGFAVFVLLLLLGQVGEFGATTPDPRFGTMAALGLEVLLTAGLVTTILATASGARNVGPNGAIAVGGYIVLSGLWAGTVSGASMNPARSLAPDVFRDDFRTTFVYILGPLIGALLAVTVEWVLKGPPTAEGNKTAQGDGD